MQIKCASDAPLLPCSLDGTTKKCSITLEDRKTSTGSEKLPTNNKRNTSSTNSTKKVKEDIPAISNEKLNDAPREKISMYKEVADIVTGSEKPISIDDFNLIRVIGRGNFSKVLMAELKENRQMYAIKVVKKELILEDEDIEWVQIEKNVFEISSNHPFLVGLHSCFQSASRLFYVIEFVQGGDMMFHMQRKKILSEEHTRFYSAEISIALHFLHERGIIYRDLKLDNVLIGSDGHVKLTDYGMCKQGIKGNDKASTFCGTPNYMAPEILRNEEYSFSVDWWALGIMMFEMMAGRSPFNIDNLEEITEEYLFQIILTKVIRPPRSLSVKAGNILQDLLNKDPNERLGCHAEKGFKEIIDHTFFSTIDWEALKLKKINPPYVPTLRDEVDLENFPNEFTTEKIEFTPDKMATIEQIDQSEFRGFEYINPLLMTSDNLLYPKDTNIDAVNSSAKYFSKKYLSTS